MNTLLLLAKDEQTEDLLRAIVSRYDNVVASEPFRILYNSGRVSVSTRWNGGA